MYSISLLRFLASAHLCNGIESFSEVEAPIWWICYLQQYGGHDSDGLQRAPAALRAL
jgi:hypothetical protein